MKVYRRTKDEAWQINYRTDGKQKQIYLGINHTQASANRIGDVIRELLLCRYRGETPPAKLIDRVRRLESKIQESVKRHGLLDACDVGVSLGEMIGRFMQQKEGLKRETIGQYRIAFNTLEGYFGTKIELGEIDSEKAGMLKSRMLTENGLSPVTVSARLGLYRSMFRFALRQRAAIENPFDEIEGGARTNDGRYRFIDRAKLEAILKTCENDRLCFAIRLGRYAGLRLPSEIRYMKYSYFGTDGFFVHENTKTGRREVPFFHELRPHFERLKETSSKDDYVFSRTMMNSNNMWRNFKTFLDRHSDAERWPRLFNNLRASCITEYDEMGFSAKTLDSIFGNTERIRKRHYVGFRRDRTFMKLLGKKNTIMDELIGHGGKIETENIDYLIRYLESLKASQQNFEPEKISLK